MFTDNYTRRAIVKRIIDGDTLDVLVDCGFRRFSYERLRLNRINTPEIRGEEREDGLVAKSFVEELLPVGTEIHMTSVKEDSFGRWLAEVYYTVGTDIQCNLSDTLLFNNLAEIYKS